MKIKAIKNMTDHQLYHAIGEFDGRKPLSELEREVLENLQKEADWRDNNIYTEQD